METAAVEGAAPRVLRRARGRAHSRTCLRVTPTRDIRKAAVIGGGTMGSGIAICFLNAGIPRDCSRRIRQRSTAASRASREIYEGQVKKGKLQAAERDKPHRAALPDAVV